jgi:hypothetical protein
MHVKQQKGNKDAFTLEVSATELAIITNALDFSMDQDPYNIARHLRPEHVPKSMDDMVVQEHEIWEILFTTLVSYRKQWSKDE